MMQVLQLSGAILILIAYSLSQMRKLDPHSQQYLILNIVGAGILAVLAAIEYQWGFLLLEGVWTIVSLWGLWKTWMKPAVPSVGATGSSSSNQ